MAVCVKQLGKTLPVWELVTLRTLFALMFLTPVLYRAGPSVLLTTRPGAHLLRSALGMGGLVCFFFSVIHLDLALATTLGFTRALFVIVLAVIFLAEKIRWRRTAATVVGFTGVILCIDPVGGSFDPWTLCALAFALFAAGVTTMVKRLTRTESNLTIVVWTYISMAAMAAIPAWLTWQTPTQFELLLIVFLGITSAAGQTCMVAGLRAGEATAVTPFEYSRLLFASVFGFFLFQEVPGINTWLGAAIIILSTMYIALRERRASQTLP